MLPTIALTGKIRAILAGIVATVFVGMAATLWIQTGRLDSALEKTGELQARLNTAVDANKSNQETIDELKDANEGLLERIRLDAVAAEAASREAAERLSELRRERDDARQRLRDDLGSTPSCEELGRLDLAAACPAFGERLQRLYERSRPH